jgi:hypothetical protein
MISWSLYQTNPDRGTFNRGESSLHMTDEPVTYLTILTKNNIFSFLGLVRAEMVDSDANTGRVSVIVKHDPREGDPVLKRFETRGEAVRNYQAAVTTSIERGWSVVYRGAPLNG